MVRGIIADERRYPTAVLLFVTEGHRWPIAGAHSPDNLGGGAVVCYGCLRRTECAL